MKKAACAAFRLILKETCTIVILTPTAVLPNEYRTACFPKNVVMPVMPGVHIGDGAIIAAYSAVTKDVPPLRPVGRKSCPVHQKPL